MRGSGDRRRGQAPGKAAVAARHSASPWQPLARPEAQSGVFLDCSGVILTSKWQCQPRGTQPAWRVGLGRASHGQESTPLALEGLSSRPGTDTPPRPGHILMGVTRQGPARRGLARPGGPLPLHLLRQPRAPLGQTVSPDSPPASPTPQISPPPPPQAQILVPS